MGKSTKIQPIDDDSYSKLEGNRKQFGPIKNRKCRDVFFLILFLLFWVGMFWVCATAVQNGQITRLFQLTNTDGNKCGSQNTDVNGGVDYSSKPYLYILNPISMAVSVCVAACPSTTEVATDTTTICRQGVTTSLATFATDSTNGDCAAYFYSSSAKFGICIPNDVGSITSSMITASGSTGTVSSNTVAGQVSMAIQAVADLNQTWPVLAVSAVAALVLSFLWLFIIQYIGSLFVWLILLAFNAILIGASIWLYFYWQQTVSTAQSSALTIDNWEVTASFSAFIAVCIIAGIFLLITIALFKKIRLAIQILKEASSAVKSMPMIVFFPIWIWASIIVLFVYFVFVMILLLTPSNTVTIPGLNLSFTDKNISYSIDGYHVFGFLWTYFFLLGVNQMTLAGGIATWYWTMDKSSMPKLPVLRSFYRVLRYHLGSIAIGSLLLAIVTWLQIFLMVLKRLKPAKSKLIQYLLCCCMCFLKCLQWIFKFINKNAYIQASITGESFCGAASSAMSLFVKNALRLVAVDMVSGFVLFVSKLGIAALIGLCSYVFLSYNPYNYTLNFKFLTVVLSGLIALFVAIAFLGVFHLAIDTIFLCFLDDCEMNDGSPERPFYMSDSLKKIVNKANQQYSNKVATRSSKGAIKQSASVDEF